MPEKLVIRTPKSTPQVSEYYLRISGRFRALKFVTLGLLVAFVVVMLLLFRSSVTYENLQYMLRDLNTAGSGNVFSTIHFDSDSVSRAVLFRGDLAVVGGKTVSLYSISGRRNLSHSLTYSSPRICTSDKYFLVYDADGKAYSVYNSYSRLHSESTDYAVTDAYVCDTGVYAIATSTREYSGAVYLYDKNFRRIGEYYKNKCVMDICLREDGKELLILSFSAAEGVYVTELSRITVGAEGDGESIVLSGAFPLAAAYRADGGFTLVTDGGLRLYGKNGELLKEADCGGELLSDFALGEDAAALITKKTENASENHILLFDTAGNILYNNTVSDKVIDAALCGRYLYLLSERAVLRINGADGSVASGSCSAGGLSLLISKAAGAGETGRPVVFYRSSALTVNPE